MATKTKKRGLALIILGAASICLALAIESLVKAFSSGSPGLMYYVTLAAGLCAVVYGVLLMRTNRT